MRVTHTTIYDASMTRLQKLVEDFNTANQQVSTGKKINRISDDPVGLSSVVGLRSNLSNLDQMTENIRTANTWLTESETALDSIEGLVEDAKILTLSMTNGTISQQELDSAAGQVQEMLGQVLDLANSQVNGQYLFAGTKVDTKPYAYDDPAAPTEAIYSGNDGAFTLKTGKNTNMVVGYSGEDIFDSKTLNVDVTNNMIDFREDDGSGFGAEISVSIPSGSYTRADLETAIGTAMTDASVAGFTYTATYDPTARTYTIQHDGGAGTAVDLMWGTGSNASQSIAPDIGFSATDVSGNTIASDQPVEWSIFKTLIDLKQYFTTGDTSGIERSMTRLDTQFDNMINAVSEIGYKGISLDIKTTVIEELDFSYSSQKADIEEVDIIEAINKLKAAETAYQAALSSTSRIMQMSLLDYM